MTIIWSITLRGSVKSIVYNYDVVLTGNINGNTIFRSTAAVSFDFVAERRVNFVCDETHMHVWFAVWLLFYLILLLKRVNFVCAETHMHVWFAVWLCFI